MSGHKKRTVPEGTVPAMSVLPLCQNLNCRLVWKKRPNESYVP